MAPTRDQDSLWRLRHRYPRFFGSRGYDPFSYICPGWEPILEELLAGIEQQPYGDRVKLLQVKEKFGTLRVHARLRGRRDITPEELRTQRLHLRELLYEAQRRSATACEACGAPGRLRDGEWLTTLCDLHAKGRKDLALNMR